MLLPQFIREGAAALEALYPPEEARSLVLRLASDLCGFAPFDYIVKPETEVPEVLQDGLQRLLAGEPLQYVTGFQEFRGRRFRVTPDVLIPRPETEMLVESALSHIHSGSRILDLCTGSGCIAWSIAMEVPGAEVTGVDISEAALEVARSQNAPEPGPAEGGRAQRTSRSALIPPSLAAGPLPLTCPRVDTVPASLPPSAVNDHSSVAPRFVKADVLQVPEVFEGAPFDVITANPPYIRESEKARMHRNVLEHEPALALFVPDSDPLKFYRAVAQWAQRFLKPGGWGIVEINEELGSETAELFRAEGLKEVTKVADFFGKDRFVSFEKGA